MKINNNISYAERKRMSIKLERNNSMNINQINKKEKEKKIISDSTNQINSKKEMKENNYRYYKNTSLKNYKNIPTLKHIDSANNARKKLNNKSNYLLSQTIKTNKRKDDIITIQEEILELKLINSRCNNEIRILKEKNKSYEDIIDIKDKEMTMLRKKYMKILEENNIEQIKLKEKYESDYKLIKKNYDISIKYIKSLIQTILDLTELILFHHDKSNYKNLQNNLNQISFSGAGDCSLDLYENNFNENRDEENKKNIILEQIKEIIIEKVNNITHNLDIIIDNAILEKIEKINFWNFTNPISKKPSFNSNLKNNHKRNNINDELFSGSVSKYNISLNNEVLSNDFDFSVSKSFYNNQSSNNISASPKFNKEKENKSKNLENKSISNDNKNIFNVLEYSMLDLINSREYASSNIQNIININNTVNNNNFTENKDNNFKGFYESFSYSNSKNIITPKNNNDFIDDSFSHNKKNKENDNNYNTKDNKEEKNSDIGNITLQDI